MDQLSIKLMQAEYELEKINGDVENLKHEFAAIGT